LLFLDIHHWVAVDQHLTRSSLHVRQHSCTFAARYLFTSVMLVL